MRKATSLLLQPASNSQVRLVFAFGVVALSLLVWAGV